MVAGAYAGVGEVKTFFAIFARMNWFSTFALLAIGLSTTASHSETDPFDPEAYCAAKDGGCRKGDSIQGPPRISEPWERFDSKDPFVWAADVCLGYFLTRSESAFAGGKVSAGRHHDNSLYLDVAREDLAARAYFYDFPFGEYGVFQCEGSERADSPPDGIEFARWTQDRLRVTEGWVADPSQSSFQLVTYRNERLGVRFRVYEIGGEFKFALQADYFGPPVIMDQ